MPYLPTHENAFSKNERSGKLFFKGVGKKIKIISAFLRISYLVDKIF